jgi:hypothetical protein
MTQLITEFENCIKTQQSILKQLKTYNSNIDADMKKGFDNFVNEDTANNTTQYKSRKFDLNSFIRNCKNENVRHFVNCIRIDGQSRTKIGYSAIGTLKTAGCPLHKIKELLDNYCNILKLDIGKFAKLMPISYNDYNIADDEDEDVPF